MNKQLNTRIIKIVGIGTAVALGGFVLFKAIIFVLSIVAYAGVHC